MKKFALLLTLSLLFLCACPSFAATESPLFLLGNNGQMEVHHENGDLISTLKIEKKPVKIITENKGQKILLCKGEISSSKKSIPGTLRLLSADYQSFSKTIEFNSVVNNFCLNQNKSILWVTTLANSSKKEQLNPTLYQIDLETFTSKEFTLDSNPCTLELNNSEKILAISTWGGKKSPSFIKLFELTNFTLLTEFQVPQSPSKLLFNSNDQTLLALSYNYFTKKPIPETITYFDLTTMKVTKQERLDLTSERLNFSQAEPLYFVVKQKKKQAKVVAFNFEGKAYEVTTDFIPKLIQENPDTKQLFIQGDRKLCIYDPITKQIIQTLITPGKADRICFLPNHPYAYLYHVGASKLSTINLAELKLEPTTKVGRTGWAKFKIFLTLLAMVGNAHNAANTINYYYYPTYFITPFGNTILFETDQEKKLYLLNSLSNDITVYDLKNNRQRYLITGISSDALYLQLTPNRKYLVEVNRTYPWELINLQTEQKELTIKVNGFFQIERLRTPYYNPAGNMLYIPSGKKIIVVDLETGKRLKDLKTKLNNPEICW